MTPRDIELFIAATEQQGTAESRAVVNVIRHLAERAKLVETKPAKTYPTPICGRWEGRYCQQTQGQKPRIRVKAGRSET
jgi:hypothetical protein